MEPDFSGYATKAGLRCTDGRTIKADAFKHQDKMQVPLVWSHSHHNPMDILGHAILENRDESHPEGAGVYAYGFFNDTENGVASRKMVQHKDITHLSIYANNLVERSKEVIHGAIKEVSLVVAGANPGAKIDQVRIAHSEYDIETLDDEAVIFTDIPIQHSDESSRSDNDKDQDKDEDTTVTDTALEHAEESLADIFDTMNQKQQDVALYMVNEALKSAKASAQHSDDSSNVLTTEDAPSKDTTTEDTLNHQEGTDMTRNIFEQANDTATPARTLSHAEIGTIFTEAQRSGSLKDTFLAHAVEYGIENIDILFPDAKTLRNNPDVIGRRQEWVQSVLTETKHSPFARIKSTAVDLTADEARAKGYVKGNLKKEEIIKLLKRVTTPTTIYKKQKLDRDDIVDITDLNVVAWLKAEMRVMLDEELGRAVLIGDGREPDDEDAIDVDHLRPIADDSDMYAHQIVVASELSPAKIIETVLRARSNYKGTGRPTLYTTADVVTDLILLEDKVGRRLYETEEALAAALRVSKIVEVEVMQDRPDVVGIIVNLTDYTIGADAGGEVSMFDDFDIDYNQYKYLIETRVSGCLTKPKSAVVIKRTLGTVVTPTAPTFNGETNELTFPSITGVVYSVDGDTQTGTIVINETTDVEARPSTGHSFPANTNRNWTYTP